LATKSVEERLDSLETQNKELRFDNERLQAVIEIQNLMGRYEYLHTAMQHRKIAELFAKKSPEVSAEMAGLGNWIGAEGIDKLFCGMFYLIEEDPRGKMFMHTLTTPVIEVAGDGKTAKGIWLSPGQETAPDRKTGRFQAAWAWCSYECDFIKEDGRWKFLHFRLNPILYAPYEKSWVEVPYNPPEFGAHLPDKVKPTKPNNNWPAWSPTVSPTDKRLPPEPYETLK
jgi:hypothetical protein